MTTHLRARTAQAGAFLALVAGVVAGTQTAALADPPTVEINAANEAESGSTLSVSYTVSNPAGPDGNEGEGQGQQAPEADVQVNTNGATCRGACGGDRVADGSSNTFDATLKLPTVDAGQSRQVTFTVRVVAGDERAERSVTINVKGPEAPTTVRSVSGRVKDDSGDRVSGVRVVMQDSQGHQYTTDTNGSGSYSFNSSDSQPIAAGSIKVAAAKDGYKAASLTVQGTAGNTVNVPLTITKVAAQTSSPTPSPSATKSAPASAAPVDEETAGDEGDNKANTIDTTNAADNADDEGANWLLIIMGALLVAAGIGAMALVWMRRKKAEELSSDTGIGKAVPAGAGFDATRVAAPVGAGRAGNDATMIAPAAGMGGASLADAPTMIHRPAAPVEDEFPDPYGAPLPPNGGYGGATNQWGNEAGGGNYGGATQPYGQQAGGYGAAPQAGGYADGGQQRFDEHTSMYQPDQPQRYDEHTSMYQPDQGNGYGGAAYSGDGYDQGGYDQHGNYAGQGGYDQGGYPQQGGYDQHGGYPPQQQQAGWDDQHGGYPPQQQQAGWDDQQQKGWNAQQQQGGYDQRRPNRDWND
ncbi:carboxypeptidase regulatory-like domain-containing protein [Actinoplanes utahensis]|uniref:carboxypeptidase regulatory-like domain-containing protein n=1 Tax=Actinoplanes utahensis TaxID=1869 RepID=UPI00126A5CF4|nr:carboxypeptidase regulatory-like domain-containing protein [Actinoplanes utahensis]GIF30866.1 hypothetical protein Aut01nite_38520 [Actinoplanes utahensis]